MIVTNLSNRSTATRWVLSAITIGICSFLVAAPQARAQDAAGYMQKVTRELVIANRKRSISSFADVLRRHMDIPSVGLTALGPYVNRLPRSDRPDYYSAMISFISRYAAKESGNYAVANAVVTGQSRDSAGAMLVDTTVTLSSGMTYDVRWKLFKRGSRYKVRDAQVLGMWMTPYLDDLFQKHISDNGNNPQSLVTALNLYR